jgi:hypothetical protein
MNQPSNEMNAEEAMHELCETLFFCLRHIGSHTKPSDDDMSVMYYRLTQARYTLTRAMRPAKPDADMPKFSGAL